MSNATDNKTLVVADSPSPNALNSLIDLDDIIKEGNIELMRKELNGLDIPKWIERLWTLKVFNKTEKVLFGQMQAVDNAMSIILARGLEQKTPEGTESYTNSFAKLSRTYLQLLEALHKLREKRLREL